MRINALDAITPSAAAGAALREEMQYAIRPPDGTWEDRWRLPPTTPVIHPRTGRMTPLTHRGQDVTQALRLAAEGDRLRGEHAALGSDNRQLQNLATVLQESAARLATAAALAASEALYRALLTASTSATP